MNKQSTVYGRTLAHGVNVVRLAGSGLKNVNDSLRLRRKDPTENRVWVPQTKRDRAIKKLVLPQLLVDQLPQLH